jgi:hypothetical protein
LPGFGIEHAAKLPRTEMDRVRQFLDRQFGLQILLGVCQRRLDAVSITENCDCPPARR